MLNKSNIDYIKRSEKYTGKVYWETPKHNHSFWEFVLGVNGCSQQYINNNSFDLQHGNLLVIRPGDVQSYKIKDVKFYQHTDFYVNTEDMFNTCNFYDKNLFNEIMANDTIMLKLNEVSYNYILNNLDILNVTQTNKNDSRSEYLSKTVLNAIVFEIINQKQAEQDKIPEWYTTILTALHNPEYICGTLEDLVKLTYLSHGYLCKLFKEQTGERLIDYFTKAKLDYSKKLMLNESYNILDISSMIGYSSFSHYIRVFKNYNKITPHDYRKRMLKK